MNSSKNKDNQMLNDEDPVYNDLKYRHILDALNLIEIKLKEVKEFFK